MDNKKEYINQKYISREVKQIINEHADEIEIEIVQFHSHWYVYATICNEFGDFDGEGRDLDDEREAARKALEELYGRAYMS